jgi:hypothetical protein
MIYIPDLDQTIPEKDMQTIFLDSGRGIKDLSDHHQSP